MPRTGFQGRVHHAQPARRESRHAGIDRRSGGWEILKLERDEYREAHPLATCRAIQHGEFWRYEATWKLQLSPIGWPAYDLTEPRTSQPVPGCPRLPDR